MTATVTIVEIKSGKVVGRYPISLGGLNYTPSQDEYVEEAWRAAVEDNSVKADERQSYRFTLST
jgi:hypothetical protein